MDSNQGPPACKDNTAGNYGGGISINGNSTITNSTIANNHSDNNSSTDDGGGGLYIYDGTHTVKKLHYC